MFVKETGREEGGENRDLLGSDAVLAAVLRRGGGTQYIQGIEMCD